MSDVLIIGSGPAGYTSAIYSARAGYKVQLITGMQCGGQLTIAEAIENYPGYASITGPELMEKMREQTEKLGVEMIYDTICSVDFAKSPFTCVGENATYEGRAVVIATGASAKWLGLASEEKYRGRGVSACATCDGFFFRNKVVAVIGGGNTALSEAAYLTTFAQKVYLILRRDKFHAEKIVRDRVINNPKIEVVYSTEVEDIVGDGSKVTGLKLINVANGKNSELAVDGVFVAVGYTPASAVFKGHITLDDHGYILTEQDNRQTSVPGVFAAGDVCNRKYRQAIVAAGQGCMAAMDVEKFLGSL